MRKYKIDSGYVDKRADYIEGKYNELEPVEKAEVDRLTTILVNGVRGLGEKGARELLFQLTSLLLGKGL